MTATLLNPRFDHLLHLTDRRGTFEHASFAAPRPEHGYCTDDMARLAGSRWRSRALRPERTGSSSSRSTTIGARQRGPRNPALRRHYRNGTALFRQRSPTFRIRRSGFALGDLPPSQGRRNVEHEVRCRCTSYYACPRFSIDLARVVEVSRPSGRGLKPHD